VVAGAAAGGVASFFLITLRFAVVFLAFLEDFFAFFFAIRLLDGTAACIPKWNILDGTQELFDRLFEFLYSFSSLGVDMSR